MKTGARVYAAIRLGHYSGRSIPQGARGTVISFSKGKSYSIKSAFGPKRGRYSGKALVRWDDGLEGHYDEEVLTS